MKLDKETFIKYLNKNFIFESNPTVAIAVSGGADSMALIFLIKKWSEYVNGNVIALIVDHNLRNDSSEEALNIANELKKKKINLKILSIKKNKLLKKSMKEARNNRYEILTNYCKKKNILHLFVGHHKDDNIETFINRKISGSNFEGLQSIKKISLNNKVCIIRPLLNYSKLSIIQFNNLNKIHFIDDPSNINLKFTRPIIRKFLKETNYKIKKKIEDDFKNIQLNSKLYNLMISETLIYNIIEVRKDFIKINYEKFKNLDVLISSNIIKKFYYFFNDKNTFLKSKKIEICIDQLKKENFKEFNLKSIIIKKVNNSLIFTKKLNNFY